MNECVICPKPVADAGAVCHPCSEKLATELRWLASNAAELETTIARQSRIGESSGRPSAETRLPIDWEAVIADDSIRNTLTTWARVVIDERGCPPPADSLPDLAGFLADQVSWLRHREYADQVWDELGYACLILKQAVDSPAERQYLGRCLTRVEDGECEQDIYVHPGASYVTCRECGAQFDVQARRQWLLKRARNTLAPATQIASTLSMLLARRIAPGTVRSWATRGRLIPRGRDRSGDRLYRLGDAITLAIDSQRKKTTV